MTQLEKSIEKGKIVELKGKKYMMNKTLTMIQNDDGSIMKTVQENYQPLVNNPSMVVNEIGSDQKKLQLSNIEPIKS